MTPHELRQRRTACHLTQTELGRRADIAQPHICAMEAGGRTIGPETAERLEAALTDVERARSERKSSIKRAVDFAFGVEPLAEMREQAGLQR